MCSESLIHEDKTKHPNRITMQFLLLDNEEFRV